MKPPPGQLRDLLKSARFFKEVRCSRDDFELLNSAQFGHRLPVQLDHREVFSTDDKQNGSPDTRQRRTGKIRPTTTRDYSLYDVRPLGCGHQ